MSSCALCLNKPVTVPISGRRTKMSVAEARNCCGAQVALRLLACEPHDQWVPQMYKGSPSLPTISEPLLKRCVGLSRAAIASFR